MLKTTTLIVLSIVAVLFFMTGIQVFTYAQMSNDTSMAGNMTNATMANATQANVTSGVNLTENAYG